jgi:enamine deaminase RidA (YjgF/YER057c/UK114 family)
MTKKLRERRCMKLRKLSVNVDSSTKPGSPAMPKHKFLNPDAIAKPIGYTHVVEPVSGRIVFISGQLGLDLDNKIVGAPGDFGAQAEQTFINLRNALAAVGADFTHVVKFTSYFTDISHLGVFREVRDRFVDTAAPPASTAIAISTLARPGALIEVEAIAVIPAKAASPASGSSAAASRSKAPAKPKSAAKASGAKAKSTANAPAKKAKASRKRR